MKECIEFNLTPFEQMMESVNVELDDFEIDDVFQEGQLFDKLSRKFKPVLDSLEFDPKIKDPLDEDANITDEDTELMKFIKKIKLAIKTIIKIIIAIITGFIRNIGYRRPSKISKYGTVFVNKDELEYCDEMRKQLKKITDNFEDLVIGAVLRKEAVDHEMDKLSEINRNRKVQSALVSSSKLGKPMTIGELNLLLDNISDTIDNLIKKINKGFKVDVVSVKTSDDEKRFGEYRYKILINDKVVYEDSHALRYYAQDCENIIKDYTANIAKYIQYLKDFQQELIDDVNSLKNIGDNKIDKTIDDYMI